VSIVHCDVVHYTALASEAQAKSTALDIRMPMTNGINTLKYLRSFERTAQIPVIFISGDYTDENLTEIALAPRAAFLQKPLDLADLNTTAERFLHLYPVAR